MAMDKGIIKTSKTDEISGIVFDIDHFAAHDGPGIRTSVFLKGCPLRCAWCHSPESQDGRPQLLYASSRCTSCLMCGGVCPHGLHTAATAATDSDAAATVAATADTDSEATATADSVSDSAAAAGHVFSRRELCDHCGRCAAVCPSGALRMSGKLMSAGEVAREALEDAVFYANSGGGVTLSGGEILFQADFAREILRLIKRGGSAGPALSPSVHTIVETTGCGRESDLLSLVPYADRFYYDYKLSDAALYGRYVGGGMELVFSNLKKLRGRTDGITLRVPLIPGVTDTAGNLRAAVDLAVELCIGEVHLLPYNAAAAAKYEWTGRAYGFNAAAPNPPDIDGLRERAAKSGANLQISIIK